MFKNLYIQLRHKLSSYILRTELNKVKKSNMDTINYIWFISQKYNLTEEEVLQVLNIETHLVNVNEILECIVLNNERPILKNEYKIKSVS